MSFGQRAASALAQLGRVCLGIDPSPASLAAWHLPDTPEGLASFSGRLIEAAHGRCGFVKPQAAFFERHGAAGISLLEQVLLQANQAGLITILDVKRGDIGSTMTGYAQAYLGQGAPLRADSITLSPYLGFRSLEPAIDLALTNQQGVFVLALTSNQEGLSLQNASVANGLTVAQDVLRQAANCNRGQVGLGSVGVVVGATVGQLEPATCQLLEQLAGPILAPGIGAQGATAKDVKQLFGKAYRQVIAPVSRAIAQLGPDLAAMASGIVALQKQLD